MSLAAKTLTRRNWRRRHFLGLVILFVTFVWCLVWGASAYHFSRAMNRWLDYARTHEIGVNYADRYMDGTLLSVHIHLNGLDVTGREGSALHAQESVFYLNILNWRDVSAKLRKEVKGSIGATPFSIDAAKFGVAIPSGKVADHRETGLALWLHAFGLSLETKTPLPFDNQIGELMIDGRIMGGVPDFSDKDSVKAWNDAGGVFEVDRVYLRWGPIVATGSGTLALDSALQPEGAFSGRIEGMEAGIAKLAEKGLIDKRQESRLYASVQTLARPSSLMGSSAPIVPISAQNGGLYLGPVKLMSLPKIEW